MRLDDEICYCFHVPLRKLLSFGRRERIRRASQLSRCLGAGTGCGWCIPMLKKIHEQILRGRQCTGDAADDLLPDTPQQYADARKAYLQSDRKHTF